MLKWREKLLIPIPLITTNHIALIQPLYTASSNMLSASQEDHCHLDSDFWLARIPACGPYFFSSFSKQNSAAEHSVENQSSQKQSKLHSGAAPNHRRELLQRCSPCHSCQVYHEHDITLLAKQPQEAGAVTDPILCKGMVKGGPSQSHPTK